MKAAALRGALSDRARNDRVHVVSSIVSGDTPSTRTAAQTLAAIVESQHILVVAERDDELAWKSLRNVPSVHLLEPGQLNTYDVLISDDVVFTRDALEEFLAFAAPSGTVTVTPAGAAGDTEGAAGETEDTAEAADTNVDDTVETEEEQA
jgi:large subunit ribosomal protein L4